LVEILRNSAQGGKNAVESLNGWLKKFPELQSLVTQHFDLCTRTEGVWIARLATGSLIAKEAIKQEIENLKREAAGKAPTGLERILVSTVAVTYNSGHSGHSRRHTPLPRSAFDRFCRRAQENPETGGYG